MEDRPCRYEDLVHHLSNAGEGLRHLLSDRTVLVRLKPSELGHLAAALESVIRAWDCMEHVAGLGPSVPRVEPLGRLPAPGGLVH